MIRRQFVVREDDNGIAGWVLKNAPSHFDSASSGMLIAHDCIEHESGAFDLAGELRAFGAMLYIRAGGSYWSNFTRARYTEFAQQAAGDIVRFVFMDSHGHVPNPGRTTRIDSWAEDEITDLLAQVWEELLSELGDEPHMLTKADFRAVGARIRGWMRKGYRATIRRFHGASSFALCNMFYNLEQLCDDASGFDSFNEWDVLTVTIDPRSLETSISFSEDWDQ